MASNGNLIWETEIKLDVVRTFPNNINFRVSLILNLKFIGRKNYS